MIPRYSRPEMAGLWTDEAKYSHWLRIETLALEAMVKEGLAPASAAAAVKSKGAFSVARTLEIEKEVKHDVIAFLTNVAENVGPEARFLHRGMTSSDVLDTCFALQLKASGELILSDLDGLCAALRRRAEEHKHTVCVGRSHGIHAEPTTFGLKLASFYAEFKRAAKRLEAAIAEVSCGKIAGAVGTYASVSPEVELSVLSSLGLKPETVPSQIVHRDRHAAFFSALALTASSVERLATEIRHLQRTEVGEVEESFTKGQKGSSAMPHKKNPILCENLCGLARMVRGSAHTAMENVALWHERDISHSSAERVLAPDSCILTDFMLSRLTAVVDGLVVHSDRMLRNLNLTGTIYSGTVLIALADAGLAREEAYRIVQENAMAAVQGGPSFVERIKADERVATKLSADKIAAACGVERHLAKVDYIFDRTFKGETR